MFGMGAARGPALGKIRPRIISGREKMGLPWDAYYILTKAQTNLPNSKVHPNSGAPDYNIVHNISDLADKSHTLLDDIGSKTHAQIDSHISGTGADHSYINQDVKTTASPTFENITLTEGFDPILVIEGQRGRMEAFQSTLALITHGANGILFISGSDITVTATRFRPVTGGIDLGLAAAQWRDLFLSRNLSDGTNSLTVAEAKTAFDHVSSNGADHSYINQDVTNGANVIFGTIDCGAITTTGTLDMSLNSIIGVESMVIRQTAHAVGLDIWGFDNRDTRVFSVYINAGGNPTLDSSSGNINLASGVALKLTDNAAMRFGTGNDYTFVYDSAATLFRLRGNAGIMMEIQDGTLQTDWFGTMNNKADVIYSGDGSGIAYGGMCIEEADNFIVTIGGTTPEEVFDASNPWVTEGTNLFTFSDHHLEAELTGQYKIDWTMALHTDIGGPAEIHAGIMIDGTALRDTGETHRTVANINDIGSISGTAIIDLTAIGKEISLWVANSTSTDLHINHANMTVVMVGGT